MLLVKKEVPELKNWHHKESPYNWTNIGKELCALLEQSIIAYKKDKDSYIPYWPDFPFDWPDIHKELLKEIRSRILNLRMEELELIIDLMWNYYHFLRGLTEEFWKKSIELINWYNASCHEKKYPMDIWISYSLPILFLQELESRYNFLVNEKKIKTLKGRFKARIVQLIPFNKTK